MILAVALSPSLDRTLVVDRIRLGGITRPQQVVQVAGGKGFNVARAAQALAVPVTAFGILGGPTGTVVAELLGIAQVPVVILAGAQNTRTCTSIAARNDGSLTEFYEPATGTAAEFEHLAEAVLEAVAPGQWVALAGSLPPTVAPDRLADLVTALRDRGARVALDSSGPALEAALDAGLAVVKVNAAEAAEIVGQDAPPASLVRSLRARSGALAVVTAGSDGAWAMADEVRQVDSPVRGGFPVGSGDCFLAGLLAGLAQNSTFDEAVRQAAAVAAANALRPGAAVFSRDDVDAIEQRLNLR